MLSPLPARHAIDTTWPSATRHIAIVGAGASGLCAARYCKEAGFNVTVFEIGTQVGGLWCYGNDNGLSSAYKTLHINTAKTLTNFSDFPFPEDIQLFPSHWDMHRYFESSATATLASVPRASAGGRGR